MALAITAHPSSDPIKTRSLSSIIARRSTVSLMMGRTSAWYVMVRLRSTVTSLVAEKDRLQASHSLKTRAEAVLP